MKKITKALYKKESELTKKVIKTTAVKVPKQFKEGDKIDVFDYHTGKKLKCRALDKVYMEDGELYI